MIVICLLFIFAIPIWLLTYLAKGIRNARDDKREGFWIDRMNEIRATPDEWAAAKILLYVICDFDLLRRQRIFPDSYTSSFTLLGRNMVYNIAAKDKAEAEELVAAYVNNNPYIVGFETEYAPAITVKMNKKRKNTV